MHRIAIIGSPGAGKTTLAQQLGSRLHSKPIHLDRLFWKSGWQSLPWGKREDILECVIRKDAWIIEGTYLDSSSPRLRAADTIIFLDTRPMICLWRLIKRHYESGEQYRRDIPTGCTDKLSSKRLGKVLAFGLRDRQKLLNILQDYQGKKIIRLSSNKEVEMFLANPLSIAQQGTYDFTFCQGKKDTRLNQHLMPQNLSTISL